MKNTLEHSAQQKFISSIDEALKDAEIISHWGDGHGGYLLGLFESRLSELYGSASRASNIQKKKKINQKVRTFVFERDEYRCVFCGSFKSLTLDHIHPESLGGGSDIDNLQTLCKSCNSKKGVKI